MCLNGFLADEDSTMDRQFWGRVIPAFLIAAGIALAGYFVGGSYVVVETSTGGVAVVDRFSGGVSFRTASRVNTAAETATDIAPPF